MTDEAARALAAMAAALVVPHDISGTLVDMMAGMQSALDAETCGILASDQAGQFEVLSVSSHSPADLALFDAQTVRGPGVSAFRLDRRVIASGLPAVRQQWPDLASAMEAGGHRSVLACPLRWHGEPLGAAAVFRRGPAEFSDADGEMLQAFADLSMLVVVHSDRVMVRTAAQRMDEALETRVLIEQAKGVISHQRRSLVLWDPVVGENVRRPPTTRTFGCRRWWSTSS